MTTYITILNYCDPVDRRAKSPAVEPTDKT